MAGDDCGKRRDAYFRRAGRSALASRAPPCDDEYFEHGRCTLVELMRFVDATPPERALEIGCGDGRVTENLAAAEPTFG